MDEKEKYYIYRCVSENCKGSCYCLRCLTSISPEIVLDHYLSKDCKKVNMKKV